MWVLSLGWKIPWSRAWQPTPVFLPGESHEQRTLAGCSPQGCKELDTTEMTIHACPGVQLLYNVVLVPTVQQSESVTHIYVCVCIHILYIYILFFRFPSHLGHHRAASGIPCATRQVLISYLFYMQYQQCLYIDFYIVIPFWGLS